MNTQAPDDDRRVSRRDKCTPSTTPVQDHSVPAQAGGSTPPLPTVARSSGPHLPHDPDDELLTTKEVADMLRVSEKTVRDLAEVGDLRGFRVGKRRQWRFRKKDVLSYMARHSNDFTE